jgi:hypothetical protein
VAGEASAGTLTVQLLVIVWPGATVPNVVGVLAAAVQPAGAVRLKPAIPLLGVQAPPPALP